MAAEEIVYRIDRLGARRAALFHAGLALGVLTVAAVGLLITSGSAALPQVLRIVLLTAGVLGFVAFGWLSLLFLRRLVSEDPLLVLRRYGLYDNASEVFTGRGWIPWSDVEDVRVGSYQGLPSVEVVLGRSALARGSRRIGRTAGDPGERVTLVLRGPLLPLAPNDLAEEIRQFWQRADHHDPETA